MTVPGRTDPAILAAAADVLLRLREQPDDPAANAAAAAWIAADPRHRHAWDLARRAWNAAGEAEPAARPRRRPRRFAAALLAAACIACAVFLPDALIRLRADAITPPGVTRGENLPDGSTMTLAGDSAAALTFDANARGVALLRGAAFFQVRRDPDRAFRVTAAGLTITVHGTAFDVDIGDDHVAVAVESGVVSVEGAGERTVLRAGDRLDVRGPDHRVVLAKVAPEDVAAWRNGRLIVRDAPLGEALDELRRAHAGSILIAAPGLRDRRVTGAYDLGDPERAARALIAPYGGTLLPLTARLWLVGGPDFPHFRK